MEKVVSAISKAYPCREAQIQRLFEYYGNSSEIYPQSLYIFGHNGTGKSVIVEEFLSHIDLTYVIVSCIECYTQRILFETILTALRGAELSEINGYAAEKKCDSVKDFLDQLQVLDAKKSYVIVLDNAERLRDMEVNILPVFLRLREHTQLNISAVLLASIPFEKFYLKSGLIDPIVMFWRQYTKVEVEEILCHEFDAVREWLLQRKLFKGNALIAGINLEFYRNYVSVFLQVFFNVCRDLHELRILNRDCFEKYCEPVVNGTIFIHEVNKLYQNIVKPLQQSLSKIYMRMETDYENELVAKRTNGNLELPFYAKYLLIAAFLASHNEAKEDKRMFMKNHGKQRKRMQKVNAKSKLTEKMATQLGPKAFTIDRVLAIFYAILDEKVGLTCNLLSQISSLVHLKFLNFVGGEKNIMDGSARLQCIVTLEFITLIGKSVGFNVRQYLCDFL